MEYNIWSIKHMAWYRKHEAGYTPDLREAGRFCELKAIMICQGANYKPELPSVTMVPAGELALQTGGKQ